MFFFRIAPRRKSNTDFAVSAARRVYFFFVSIWLSSLAGAETEISTDNTWVMAPCFGRESHKASDRAFYLGVTRMDISPSGI